MTAPDASKPPPEGRARDRLAVWSFVLLWLVPVSYGGIMRRAPPLPAALIELTNVTCLFSRAQPIWSAFYVQVRTTAEGPWIELDTRPYFGLEPFGHRKRIDRYLVAWSDTRGRQAREELAQWLMQEHERQHPRAPAPVELRFVVAPLGVRDDRPPTGAWVRPSLDEVPPNHRRIVSMHARRTRS